MKRKVRHIPQAVREHQRLMAAELARIARWLEAYPALWYRADAPAEVRAFLAGPSEFRTK